VRAFVITAPGTAGVCEVAEPAARPGQVVVDVLRAGVCGTDAEFFSGAMAYLHSGEASYPIRVGHEWCGVVSAVGDGVDSAWLGRSVTGDTMLGCGRCARCRGGRQHLCAQRYEIGIRRGWPGALARRLPVPASALHVLPADLDPAVGALVEPGGNALRAVDASGATDGTQLLVLGPGTIGLLAAQIARARGADVHLLGLSTEFPRALGFPNAWTADTLPEARFDAVIDASTASALPALAVDLVEPGGRVVYIGLSGEPSLVDSRRIALKDVTAVGILSASGGLAGAIELYASGAVDPRPLVAATLPLADAAAAFTRAPGEYGPAPKIHIDPTR
jgi:threonine dehydrogenase-like Zn-dependent dehydrogenase